MKPLFDDKKSDAVSDRPSMPSSAPVAVSAATNAANTANVLRVPPAHPTEPARLITVDEIDQLGATQGARIAAFSQQILASVRASDADQFGDKLNELIATAKGLDPRGADKGGLLTQVTRLFRSTKEKLLSQYESVSKRMDTLVVELEHHAQRQKAGIDELERMYNDNYALHQDLAQAKALGEAALAALRAHAAAGHPADDAFAAQRLLDVKRKIDALESKLDDLDRAMLMSKQLAPQIRMEQDQKRTLTSKFMTIKTVLIPAWTNAFALYLEQLSTKRAAALANATYDAADEAIRAQADLNRQNAQEIAKLGQRPVISTDTFEYAQQQLFGAFDDVTQIIADGKRQREQDAPRLRQLEQELITRFAPKHN
ncbi:toxic anion resistance protein [Burkholderia vietnamiensis]|uniref:toxic anion resistance protein n=1 Tax=Burkholderia vietnamiensis TaxID=60552 RepID=UPI001CB41A77|nr:toxic anion resistance protein [Burkholderia vietnamiensis]CAG9203955.1 Toxic anion resistance [Burkholderia vietnamiensis]HDR8966496.1 toxic anion resistance protein [Burkholderia vietnamiensis]